MGNRWFTSLIVLMWLTTTTWLIVAKVVPPLKRGEPPNYRSMYSLSDQPDPPVGWEMSIGGKPLGWSVMQIESRGEMLKVHSHIHFDRIPLLEFSQAWMKAILPAALRSVDDLQMDADTELSIDSLGHLSNFISTLRANNSDYNAIRIRGRVQTSQLNITVEVGDAKYHFETFLPGDALVTDELSPQARLTGLHLGQEWTVPVFSPLRDPNSPIEILQAQVESRDLLMWDERAVPVNVVVYRADSGSAMSSTREPRSKLWICDDGTVLKQEVSILKTQLLFSRASEEQAERWYKVVKNQETGMWSGTHSRQGQAQDSPAEAGQHEAPTAEPAVPPDVAP